MRRGKTLQHHGPQFEQLEPRLLLSADITWVSSGLDNFRFIAGQGVPSLHNTTQSSIY